MWVKKQQLEPDIEQLTGSKLGKEDDKAIYCHPVYLAYIQSTSCEMLGWMNHKLESRLLREISTTSDIQASLMDEMVKNPPTNAGGIRDMGSIPESVRSPGEGNGNTLQSSCLENSMDRGAGGLQSMRSQRVRHN